MTAHTADHGQQHNQKNDNSEEIMATQFTYSDVNSSTTATTCSYRIVPPLINLELLEDHQQQPAPQSACPLSVSDVAFTHIFAERGPTSLPSLRQTRSNGNMLHMFDLCNNNNLDTSDNLLSPDFQMHPRDNTATTTSTTSGGTRPKVKRSRSDSCIPPAENRLNLNAHKKSVSHLPTTTIKIEPAKGGDDTDREEDDSSESEDEVEIPTHKHNKKSGSFTKVNHVVTINDPEANKQKRFPNNYIRTTKYTPITFLPLNLFEQFRRISNIYFLITMIVALIPGVSPIFPITSILPLVIILSVTAFKDGLEDFGRHRADKAANSAQAKVVRDGKEITVSTKDVVVGDIVRVDRGGEIPADMILLSSALPDSVAYIETANLDGETNLKVKRGLEATKDYDVPDRLCKMRGKIICEDPNEHMYQFKGTMTIETPQGDKSLPLGPKQLLLRGSRLRNTKWVYGLVVYAGVDTKLFKNLKDKGSKFSYLDRKLNKALFGLLALQEVIAGIFVLLSCLFQDRTGYDTFFINAVYPYKTNFEFIVRNWLTYFVLLNLLIPMSLFVSLEVNKAFQAKFMEFDDKMSHEGVRMIAKTSNLNEELSQVDYVFSDKTGTLTENLMRVSNFSVDGIHHDEQKFPGALKTMLESEGISEDRKWMIREFLTCIAVCHSVIPERDDETGEILYEGQSTDEVALLQAARTNGFELLNRTNSGVQISALGKKLYYQELACLEFTPERKRMSVITRTPEGTIVLYAKGADNMMLQRSKIDDELLQDTLATLGLYSQEGLRTLVFSRKEFTEEEFQRWICKYERASTSMDNREEQLVQLAEEIEKDLQMIGCSAIEDKLQDQVPETIEYLIKAGIKVWVLTGDKRETAVNIAQSSRLITDNMKIVHIDAESADECKEQLQRCLEDYQVDYDRTKKPKKFVAKEDFALVIDGKALKYALKECQDELADIARICTSAICCRVTPLQKALMVRMVEKKLKKKGLSIGDGANDVSMIQEANVGVGILGREGSQAARASDYAIPRFRHLKRLLAVHGRYCYVRNSKFIQYSFYKNNVLVFTQLIYAFFNGFTGRTLYDSWFITLYNTIFTSLPPIILGIFEKDIQDDIINEHPEVYKRLRKGVSFNAKTLILWNLSALYTSVAIFFGLYALSDAAFPSNTLNIGFMDDSASFGCVAAIAAMTVVTLKATLETSYFTGLNLAANSLCYLAFFVFLAIYNSFPLFMDNGEMYFVFFKLLTSPIFYAVIALILALCLLPEIVFKYLRFNWFPHDWQILLKEDLHKKNKSRQRQQLLGKHKRKSKGKDKGKDKKLKNQHHNVHQNEFSTGSSALSASAGSSLIEMIPPISSSGMSTASSSSDVPISSSSRRDSNTVVHRTPKPHHDTNSNSRAPHSATDPSGVDLSSSRSEVMIEESEVSSSILDSSDQLIEMTL